MGLGKVYAGTETTLWWHLSHSAEIGPVNSLGSAKHSAQEKLIIIILAQGLFLITSSISVPSCTVRVTFGASKTV